MRLRSNPRCRSRSDGFTLLELMLALGILSTILMATASAFSSNLSAANTALARTRGTVFLGRVMEDLSAQSYDGLLALNGNRILDQVEEERSAFGVDLTVFTVEVGLIQVQADLVQLPDENVLARTTTLRCDR